MSITNLKSLIGCSVLCAVLLLILIVLGQVNIISIPCVCAVCYALHYVLS